MLPESPVDADLLELLVKSGKGKKQQVRMQLSVKHAGGPESYP